MGPVRGVLAGWLRGGTRTSPPTPAGGRRHDRFCGSRPSVLDAFRAGRPHAARSLHGIASGGARRSQTGGARESDLGERGVGFRTGRFRGFGRPRRRWPVTRPHDWPSWPALNDRGAPGGLRDPSGRGRAWRVVSADRGRFIVFLLELCGVQEVCFFGVRWELVRKPKYPPNNHVPTFLRPQPWLHFPVAPRMSTALHLHPIRT